MAIGTAFRAFFGALFDSETSIRIEKALAASGPATAAIEDQSVSVSKEPKVTKNQSKPSRSEAVTLLNALQREARLIDLVQESLDEYSDAQVGAAARDVLRDSKKVLQRLFALETLVTEEEGAIVSIPPNPSASRWRISGSNTSATSGELIHAGWVAKQVDLPKWTGDAKDAMIIAAAEIET
jgi:hypothetical protein